ncbi:MAG: hypothetical protein C0518_13655 [Opitutus sp.]|nr:hypothetical protein [Opitutus sp.]
MKTPFVKFTALDAFTAHVAEQAARPFTSIVLLAGPRGSGRSSTLELARRKLAEKFTAIPTGEATEALVPLLAGPVAATSPSIQGKTSVLLCDDFESRLTVAARKRDLRNCFVALEQNLRRERRALVATTTSDFALHLLQTKSVVLDTVLLPLPYLEPGMTKDFRSLLYTVQRENPALFESDLSDESEALRLQVECIGLPGLLFRQLEYAEQIAVAKGRSTVKPSDLRQAALEAFKLRAIRTEFEELRLALDNSKTAFFSLSREFGLKDKQLELALAH